MLEITPKVYQIKYTSYIPEPPPHTVIRKHIIPYLLSSFTSSYQEKEAISMFTDFHKRKSIKGQKPYSNSCTHTRAIKQLYLWNCYESVMFLWLQPLGLVLYREMYHPTFLIQYYAIQACKLHLTTSLRHKGHKKKLIMFGFYTINILVNTN